MFTVRNLLLLATVALLWAKPAHALTTSSFVSTRPSTGSFTIAANGKAATILVDANDWPGVIRTATDLQADVERVTGIKPTIVREEKAAGVNTIIGARLNAASSSAA